MAARITRLKTKAVTHDVPNTRQAVAIDIRRIGYLSREHTRIKTELNDQIAAITEHFAPRLDTLSRQITTLQAGVQVFCEAHRHDLTDNGKTKTANFVTGEVQWRQRPPSCRITGADTVIEFLERMGLGRFVRIKKEINKDAILNEPAAVSGVAGISISTGIEDFIVTPFEIDAESA